MSRVNAILALGLMLYAGTALYNIGIIAVDDYADVIAAGIPAEQRSASEIVRGSGFRSPYAPLFVYSVARIARRVGFEAPISQLRFVLLIIALLAFPLLAFSARGHFRGERERLLSVGLISSYFLCPFFLTRPMIESLAAPFLSVSALLACQYWEKATLRTLLLSTIFLGLSCLLRFQVGLCAAGLLILPLLLKRYQHFLLALGYGALFFFIAGVVDSKMKGRFHATLFDYLNYNYHHSSSFGVVPFYVYILVFLGLTLPPLLVARYDFQKLRNDCRPLLPTLIFFVLFVAGHSAVPHKEERFMITVLPLFLILMVPWLSQVPKRLPYAITANLILLGFTSLSIAQNNVIGLAQAVEDHPAIKRLISLRGSLVLFPEALVSRPIAVEERGEIPETIPCDTWIVVREDVGIRPVELKRFGVFSPGLLEGLTVKLNPHQNARRGTLTTYASRDCSIK